MSNYPDDELGGRLGGLTVEDEGEGVTNMTQITENDGWNGKLLFLSLLELADSTTFDSEFSSLQ
jgi:hypothetical protein